MPLSLRCAFSFLRRCLSTPAASSMKARRSSGRDSRISASLPWPTMMCISRPIPESLNSSCTSIRRAFAPLISYSLAPSRNMRRVIATSVKSIGRRLSLLSNVSVTSARPKGLRSPAPAKITSCILPPRRFFAPCSPITQASASTTLDLPEPFGPTTAQMPGSNFIVVAEAKDLKPFSVSDFKCILWILQAGHHSHPHADLVHRIGHRSAKLHIQFRGFHVDGGGIYV